MGLTFGHDTDIADFFIHFSHFVLHSIWLLFLDALSLPPLMPSLGTIPALFFYLFCTLLLTSYAVYSFPPKKLSTWVLPFRDHPTILILI